MAIWYAESMKSTVYGKTADGKHGGYAWKYNGRGWKAVIAGRPRFHVFAAPFFVDGESKLALLKQLIRRPHYARKFHEAPATACDVPLFHPCGLYNFYLANITKILLCIHRDLFLKFLH